MRLFLDALIGVVLLAVFWVTPVIVVPLGVIGMVVWPFEMCYRLYRRVRG